MLKNKKKLRRIERNTPGYAVKAAQSLVLAGALVLGGVGAASAAAPAAWGGNYTTQQTVTDVHSTEDFTSAVDFKAGFTANGSTNGAYVGLNSALYGLTISGGTSTMSNGAGLWIDKGITISGANTVINASGIMASSDPSVARWRAGTMIGADEGLTMTGGTVNLSDNAQMVVGYEADNAATGGTSRAMAITGGTVNMRNALLRASSVAGSPIDYTHTQKFATLTVGDNSAAAAVQTAAGTHNVIASRHTTIGQKGQLNINGATMLVGAMKATANVGTKPTGAPDAWMFVDQTANGKLTNNGGSVAVADSGVLVATGIDYVQSGANSTFTASKLMLGAVNPATLVEGAGAAFNSAEVSNGKMQVGSLTIATGSLSNVATGAGSFKITGGEVVVQNLTLTSSGASVGSAFVGIDADDLAVRVLTAKGSGTVAATDLTVTGGVHLLGDGTKFLEAKSLTIAVGGTLILDNVSGTEAYGIAKGGTFTGATTVAGTLGIGASKWTLGAVASTGTIAVNGGGELTVASLTQTGGTIKVGHNGTAGKLTVVGDIVFEKYANGGSQTAGISVGTASALQADYTKTLAAVSGKTDMINVASGGIVRLTGYTGPGMSLTDFKANVSDKLLASGSTGAIEGVTITGVDKDTTLQDVGSAKAAVTGSVTKAGTLTSGAAAVGGVVGTATTAVSGGASLTLTGQGAANGKLTQAGVTLDKSSLTLGNAAGGSTGGTLVGGIDASGSSNANSINTVNGVFNVQGDIKGGTGNDTVNVLNNSILNVTQIDLSSGGTNEINVAGGALNAGSITVGTGDVINVGNESSTGQLTADSVKLGGGSLFIDPAWGEASSRVAIAQFTDGVATTPDVSAVGGLVGVGMNSMLTVGTKDVAWMGDIVGKLGGLDKDGYSAALGLYHSVTLGNGTGGIVVDGTKTTADFAGGSVPTANNATFAAGSLLVVNAPAGLGTHAALNATSGTLALDKDASLLVVNGQAGQTVKITGGFGTLTQANGAGGWVGDNLLTDTDLVYGEGSFASGTGNFSVSLKGRDATTVFPKLSASMGGLVDNVMRVRDLDSDNAGIRFVSRATSNAYLGTNDAEKAAATIEGAAQMGAVAGVQVSTIGAASVASGAVTTRTSFAQPLMDMTKAVAVHQDNDGTLSLDTGLNAGNGMKSGLGVWIMPLYQSNKTWGQKAENFKSGMSSDLGGIALGADYTINDMFRFGAAFNLGGGFGQSSGDFNKTENSFNFWGVNLYGGWTMNNFGLSADVGYSSTYNKVQQDLPASMAMGNLKADVTSSAWQAGLKGEYKFETSVVDIIPHVGVRYMGLTTDSYDVKSGGTVFGVEQDFQSIWTFPIGVAFSKTITSDSGWMFKPMIDLTVIPAAGDLDAKSKASIPGVGGNAEMKMQVVDAVTFDGGLGFEVGKDNLSFGLNYNVQASEHRTGHGVFGTLRYEF